MLDNFMIRLCDLGEIFMCGLCKGYLINAVSLMDCQHAFCRSCILNHIKSNFCCPSCGQLIHKTRPYLNIRPDPVLQQLVYRIIPGLYRNEMKRRQEFYSTHTNIENLELSKEELGLVEDFEEFCTSSTYCHSLPHIIKMQNSYYIVLKGYLIIANEIIEQEPLYLICPPTLPFQLLKKFLQNRLDLQPDRSLDFFTASSFIREDLLLEEFFGVIENNETRSLTYAVWDSYVYQREQIRSILKHCISQFTFIQNHASPTKHKNNILSSNDTHSVFSSPKLPSSMMGDCQLVSKRHKYAASLNLKHIHNIKLRLKKLRMSPDVLKNRKAISPKIFRKCGENKYSRLIRRTDNLESPKLATSTKFRSYSAERKSELRFCFRSNNNLEVQKNCDYDVIDKNGNFLENTDEEGCKIQSPENYNIISTIFSNNNIVRFNEENTATYKDGIELNLNSSDSNANKRKIDDIDNSVENQNTNISNSVKKFCHSMENDSGIFMSPGNYSDINLPINDKETILSKFNDFRSYNSEIINKTSKLKNSSPKVLERKLWQPHFENLTPPGMSAKNKKIGFDSDAKIYSWTSDLFGHNSLQLDGVSLSQFEKTNEQNSYFENKFLNFKSIAANNTNLDNENCLDFVNNVSAESKISKLSEGISSAKLNPVDQSFLDLNVNVKDCVILGLNVIELDNDIKNEPLSMNSINSNKININSLTFSKPYHQGNTKSAENYCSEYYDMQTDIKSINRSISMQHVQSSINHIISANASVLKIPSQMKTMEPIVNINEALLYNVDSFVIKPNEISQNISSTPLCSKDPFITNLKNNIISSNGTEISTSNNNKSIPNSATPFVPNIKNNIVYLKNICSTINANKSFARAKDLKSSHKLNFINNKSKNDSMLQNIKIGKTKPALNKVIKIFDKPILSSGLKPKDKKLFKMPIFSRGGIDQSKVLSPFVTSISQKFTNDVSAITGQINLTSTIVKKLEDVPQEINSKNLINYNNEIISPEYSKFSEIICNLNPDINCMKSIRYYENNIPELELKTELSDSQACSKNRHNIESPLPNFRDTFFDQSKVDVFTSKSNSGNLVGKKRKPLVDCKNLLNN